MTEDRGGYALLSRFRSELMGLAMTWVMLFHAYELAVPVFPLDLLKQLGFAGVDVFLLLSGMGQYVSLSKTRGGGPDTLPAGAAGYCRPTGWWWGCTACGSGRRAVSA